MGTLSALSPNAPVQKSGVRLRHRDPILAEIIRVVINRAAAEDKMCERFCLRRPALCYGCRLIVRARNDALAIKIRRQMSIEVACVVTGAVDKSRFAAAKELHTHQIHARRLGNASIVADLAFAIEHRHMEP